MSWLWLLSPLVLSPLVWLYLGRYAGDNRAVQALIHPPPRQLKPTPACSDSPGGAGTGAGASSAVKPPHRLRTRGLSFIATDRPSVNPFVNATPYLTPYERAKISVLSVTLLPVRLVLGVSCLALAVMWLSVCTLGISAKSLKSKPLPAWRRRLRFPTQVLTRVFMMIFGFYRVKQTGRRCKASEAAVIVPNHVSFIEPLYLGGVHMLSAVSRAENGKMPLIGRGLMALQCILVDRFDPKSRQNTKDAIARRAVPGQGWGQFMIFPEGTTCNTQAVISFAMGAFSPGQPVQPVAIRYPFKNFDPCWVVQGPGILGLSMRMLCQFSNNMEVTWLPVYKPSAEERSDAKLFARNVQKTVAAALNVPTTDHSFSDVVLAMEAQQGGIDPSAGAMVELTKLREFLDVNVRTAQKYLDTFMALDTHKTGHMDLPTFAKIFGHGVTDEIKRLFELLDTDENGSLEFREFLTGLSIINEEGKEGRKAALRLAFGMFDQDGSNRLSKAALQRILSRALPELTEAHFDELWAEADRNHDGSISMDEFLAFAEAHEDVLPVFRREYL